MAPWRLTAKGRIMMNIGTKKLAIAVLVVFLAATALAAAADLAAAVKMAELPKTAAGQEMALADLLAVMSEQTGVAFVAVPEVAGLRVAVPAGDRLTVGEVLDALTARYGLAFRFNAARQAVVVHAGAAARDALPGGLSLAHAPQGEMYKIAAVMPSASQYAPSAGFNTEEYKRIRDNGFQEALTTPVSTLSIDVDTASYSNIRRFLNAGRLPPVDAVRTEELLNYFTYDYPQPAGEHPFSVTTEVGDCPWQPGNKLVLVGLQGRTIPPAQLPPANLVFLIDVSGSMASPDKLPLLKTAFKLLVRELRPEDRVAIVVYAGRAGIVLEPTPGSDKDKIIAAIDSLQAGGSTAGGAGLKLAYAVAKRSFLPGGNNRVILATDGDFNVGESSEGGLTRLIEERRDDGIFLSVLGFGMGNIKDNKMEALADSGNGMYAYIDSAQEAKKVMVGQLAGTLYTIAKDVKLQIEFNPAKVAQYRLIGYENRLLDKRDFSDDKKDAGDMGAGHAVTVLYEIIPAGAGGEGQGDPLAYQRPVLVASDDLLQVKIRYKKPGEAVSTLFVKHLAGDASVGLPANLRFAAAVAEYAMLLRNSEFKGQATWRQALELAQGARGPDREGYRAEFIRLIEIGELLTGL
jgi:Ca-activated chloride channel family protein